jgi:hypothetical protein
MICRSLSALTLAAAMASVAVPSSQARELTPELLAPTSMVEGDQNVFVFGGRFHSHWFWDTFIPTNVPYEDNYFLGVGYQKMLFRTDWWVTFGAEYGFGARFSAADGNSIEGWTGAVARLDGFDLFNSFHVTPSLTLGLSFVTGGVGVEKARAATAPKPIDMLVYMAPEVAVSPLDNPNLEFFYRIQHRSGGLGFIMSFDGSNAATAGVRLKF